MIRRSVQYLIYTLVNYLLVQLIIISGLEHLIGLSVNCLRQFGSPACNSNWHWQKWRKGVWWGGSRRVSEVTLENLHLGQYSRAPLMGGYDNSHTRPLSTTMTILRGNIVRPVFWNGHNCLIYVLQGRFETRYHHLVSRIGYRYLWDL